MKKDKNFFQLSTSNSKKNVIFATDLITYSFLIKQCSLTCGKNSVCYYLETLFHFVSQCLGHTLKNKLENVAHAAWNNLSECIGVETRVSGRLISRFFNT
jgi:hypothetical protein